MGTDSQRFLLSSSHLFLRLHVHAEPNFRTDHNRTDYQGRCRCLGLNPSPIPLQQPVSCPVTDVVSSRNNLQHPTPLICTPPSTHLPTGLPLPREPEFDGSHTPHSNHPPLPRAVPELPAPCLRARPITTLHIILPAPRLRLRLPLRLPLLRHATSDRLNNSPPLRPKNLLSRSKLSV